MFWPNWTKRWAGRRLRHFSAPSPVHSGKRLERFHTPPTPVRQIAPPSIERRRTRIDRLCRSGTGVRRAPLARFQV
jgi:hypothetical protein